MSDTTITGAVTSNGAARAMGVTPQTIANWAKRGMATAASAGVNDAGHVLYDVDKVRAWANQNVGWVHGGKRKNSGRKPGLFAHAAKEAKEAAAGVVTSRPAPVPPLDPDDLETLEDVESMFRLAEEGKLPYAKVQALKALMDAKIKKQQYDLESGLLMDSREWATELARFLGALRTRIEAMPGRIAAALSQSLGLTGPEEMTKIRTALTAEADAWVRDVHDFGTQAAEKMKDGG
jgi:hypothetical protein